MKYKFKSPRKNKPISAKMSIVIATMLLLIMGIGYAKLSTTLTIRGTITGSYTPVSEYDYIVEEEEGESGTTMTYETPAITSVTNGVDVNTYLTMNFDGINIADKYIQKIDVIITYTTTTGKNQNINVNLTANGVTQSQNIIFYGKRTKEQKTLTYNNLHINPNDEFTITFTNVNTTNGHININNQQVKIYLGE